MTKKTNSSSSISPSTLTNNVMDSPNTPTIEEQTYISFKLCLPVDHPTTTTSSNRHPLSQHEILDQLLDPAYNLESNKTEDKTFVCYELPSGGTISKYAIEGDRLQLVIKKHPLMFSATAIHIAGMNTGHITDTPESRRGILRANGWTEALERFKSTIRSADDTFSLERTIEIQLEEEVDPKSTVHFTYCFDQTPSGRNRMMQCSFAYFEFNVARKDDEEELDKFITSDGVAFYSSTTSTNRKSDEDDGGHGGGGYGNNKMKTSRRRGDPSNTGR